jgi:hypothetical protein
MRTFYSLLTFLACCAQLSGFAQDNLVTNPGFEEPINARVKATGGWWLYLDRGEPELKIDNTVGHSGKASARLHASTDAKCTYVSAPFPVAPNDELRFEAWVRAENLPTGQKPGYVGIAFRRADGGVFERQYVGAEFKGNSWLLISGTANAPATAASAEIHLGYTNAPCTVWFDDVTAIITSPLSLSLVEGAKPWPGQQELTVLLVNRQASMFQGSIRAVVGKSSKTQPVALAPKASQEARIPITINGTGAHNYSLTLVDSTGAAVRTLEGKFQTHPALVLYPACPCYLTVGTSDTEARVDAAVNLNPTLRAGLKFVAELSDVTGKFLQTENVDASKGETVGLKLRVPVGAPATFTINARLVDRAGKEVASAATEIGVRPSEESRVETSANGFFRVAGKREFPIGMYSCGHFEEMGKAGFNGTHNYGITTGDAKDAINPNEAQVKHLLDVAMANGMRMMVELPRKAIEKAQWAQIRRRIETFRHHPGLLCWGSEERVARGEAPLANIAALYRLVHELDPDHPFVLGDTKDIIQKFKEDRRDFFPDPYMDAGIWWWYPIPLKDADGNGLDGREKSAGLLEPPSWLTTTISKKPLWIAIQSYQHPAKDARFPTPAEYRCMAYLSIINGAKGLWFYTGSGQKDYQGKPAGLLNKPEEGHWDYVQKLVTELHEFSPIIMAAQSANKPKRSPADAPIDFTTRELDGKVYVIAANKSGKQQALRFTSPAFAGKHALVLYETHSAVVEDDSLKDDFEPFGVHVYRFE